MDPSTGQNLQEMSSSDSLGNMLVGSKQQSQHQDQRKQTSKPHPEQALKCPRCDSTNTKFCYYNNYSLTQPRYFCKACRRYWTKGGTLRNVPVGGGCRRNKRSSSNNNNSSSSSTATSSATSSSKLIKPSHHHHHHDHNSLLLLPQQLSVIGGSNSSSGYDSNDLSLAFARLQKQSSCGQLLGNFDHGYDHNNNNNELIGINNSNIGFLDALRNGFLDQSSHSNNNNNMFYGFGNGNEINGNNNVVVVGNDDQNLGTHHHHMSYNDHDHDDMMIKQELRSSSSSDHNNNKVLWGCPWQLNGSSSENNNQFHGGMAEIDHTAGRESWNGLSSSWHGLLNTTPLM
ncbi:hypothetical protein CsatA_008455 [Cannabis sativa]